MANTKKPYLAAAQYAKDSGWEPQRTNNGIFRLDAAPSGISDTLYREDLILAVRNFNLPKPSSNQLELFWQNQSRKFPGKMNIPDIQVVIGLNHGSTAFNFIQNWEMLVRNFKSGAVGYASKIKTNAQIFLNRPDGSGNLVGVDNPTRNTTAFTLIGIFPLEVDYGEIDYGTDDQLAVTITFSIDQFIPGYGKSFAHKSLY